MEKVKRIRKLVSSPEISTPVELIRELRKTKQLVLNNSKAEPELKNTLKYTFYGLQDADLAALRSQITAKMGLAAEHIKKSKNSVISLSSDKIKRGSTVFAFSHDSTLLEIFKEAKAKVKGFTVSNVVSGPNNSGKELARQLSTLKLTTLHYPDVAITHAVRDADIVLLGCEAITPSGAICGLGAEIVAETAKKHNIPLYIYAGSWKFDPGSKKHHLEKQNIWPRAPKGIKAENLRFEHVGGNQITGIISEFGIYKHHVFIDELKRRNRWMFT